MLTTYGTWINVPVEDTPPTDTTLEIGDFCSLGVKRYIDTPQKDVELFKANLKLTPKRTYYARVHISAEFSQRFSKRRFVSTFIAYAYCELRQEVTTLPPSQRDDFLRQLEQEYLIYRQQINSEIYAHPPAPTPRPQQAFPTFTPPQQPFPTFTPSQSNGK